MIAAKLTKKNQSLNLNIQKTNPPKPDPGQVILHIRYAALNKRDDWILRGKYPGMNLPVIPGSDGMGYITDPDERVLLNPGNEWGDNPRGLRPGFYISGMPNLGKCTPLIS